MVSSRAKSDYWGSKIDEAMMRKGNEKISKSF